MTPYPPALSAHLERDVTTVCHAWRLTRRDGVVMGFTDHDQALTVDGTVCEPQSGLSATEVRQTLGLAVDASDVDGAISSSGLNPDDIAAVLYDDAAVETLLVNWQSPVDFVCIRRATVGTLTARDGHFTAELKSAAHRLDQVAGRLLARSCDAELGDARCGFALDQPLFSAPGSVVALQGTRTLRVAALHGYYSGWFTGGSIVWTAGPRSGRTDRILAHTAGPGGVTLALQAFDGPMPEADDTFTVRAGCDKSFATCKAKFGNHLNFRGFPHLPGNDSAYAYPVEGDVFDGAPLVP